MTNRKLENEKLNQKRLEDNTKLWLLLGDIIAKNPELRFSQILQNYGFVDKEKAVIAHANDRQSIDNIWVNEYYTEPNTILQRVKEEKEKYEIQRATINSKG